MIKLFLSDLDGTLNKLEQHGVKDELNYSQDNSIPIFNLNAIDKLFENNIDFGIVTGNNITVTKKQTKELSSNNIYYATQNGSYYSSSDDKVIIKNLFTKDEVTSLIKYANENNIIAGFESFDHEYYDINLSQENKNLVLRYNPNAEITWIDFNGHEIFEYELSKVQYKMFDQNFDSMELIEKEIANFFNNLSVTIGDAHTIDITNKKANKGEIIKQICNINNFNLNEIAYIGDSSNDVSAFKILDNSFVMSHSRNSVKKYANYIVDNVSEAVNYCIEKINNKDV